MEENKKILLSGKLSGTRSFLSDLEKIDFPDDVEKFLLEFSKLKIELFSSYDIKYINDDQEFLDVIDHICASRFISIYHTDNFSRLYLRIDSGEIFVVRLNKVSPAIVGTFITSENSIKFAINAFNFIKWCNTKSIDIKNLYDIPTYIKLLMNDVDPFKSIESYVSDYTTYIFDEDDNEKNSAFICNFIYQFGCILSEYIEEFDLTTVSKLINENSYYEGNSFNNTGNCKIILSFQNINNAIQNISQEIVNNYKEKAYIVSPLNRIAPKFKHQEYDLIYDVFTEDLSITILNELYNNNIPVKLDYSTNQYIITCKFKNCSHIIHVLTAIFSEVFYTLFNQTPEIHLECIMKE